MTQNEVRQYETIIVMDHTLAESALKSEAKRIQGIFSAHGATNIEVDTWGRKEYPHISNRSAPGYFLCYNFSSNTPTVVSDVEGILRITDSVVKFQSHKTNLKARKFKGNPKSKAPLTDDDFGDLGDLDY